MTTERVPVLSINPKEDVGWAERVAKNLPDDAYFAKIGTANMFIFDKETKFSLSHRFKYPHHIELIDKQVLNGKLNKDEAEKLKEKIQKITEEDELAAIQKTFSCSLEDAEDISNLHYAASGLREMKAYGKLDDVGKNKSLMERIRKVNIFQDQETRSLQESIDYLLEYKEEGSKENETIINWLDTMKVHLRITGINLGPDGKIQIEGGSKETEFALYLALSRMEGELGELSNALTVNALLLLEGNIAAMVLRESTRMYANNLGVAGSGWVDCDKDKDGNPIYPTTQTVKNALMEEIHEEVGVSKEDVEMGDIVAFSEDVVTLHKETSLEIRLKLNHFELIERLKNKAKPDQEEKETIMHSDKTDPLIFINASPEDLKKLLTKTNIHIPSTHTTPMVQIIVKGYSEDLKSQNFTKEEHGKRIVEYIEDLTSKIKENYKRTDSLTNEGKFNPTKTPEEQGLPSVIDELKKHDLFVEIYDPKGHKK